MGQNQSSNGISKQNKLTIVVAICLLAMIGLVLGIMLSAKVSLFSNELDTYTLSGNYKITLEDIDAIGKPDGSLELSHPCIIDLNNKVLDLNGKTFRIITNEANKDITIRNGKIKNGKFEIVTEDTSLTLQNVEFYSDYNFNTTNSNVVIINTNLDASKLNVKDGKLGIYDSTFIGDLNVKTSELTVLKSNVPNAICENTTTTILGELNGGLVINSGANITVIANCNSVTANSGKLIFAREIGSEEFNGGSAQTLNIDGSADVVIENCANVDEINVNAISTLEIGGTANSLNINQTATINAIKCAIIDKVNVNANATITYAGTSADFIINNKSNVKFGATAYILRLNIEESAGESKVEFDGKAAVIQNKSESIDLSFNRDANVAKLVKIAGSYTKNAFAKIGEEVASATPKEIQDTCNNFVMPIVYILSDCLGDGYIDFSKGGNKETTDIEHQELSKLIHEYTYKVEKKPTSTETGIGRYTCSCGHSYTVDIPARRIVLDAPTVYDFLGLNLKAGVYNYALDENSYYTLNNNDFVATSSSEEETPSYDVLNVKKAFFNLIVEKAEKTKDVKLFGEAALELYYYEDCATTSMIETEGEILSAIKADYSIVLHAYLDGSKIYITYDGDNMIFNIYDEVNAIINTYIQNYLAMLGITKDVTLDDIVNAINAANKLEVLAERYDAALVIIINALKNTTNLSKVLPTIDCIDELDGGYSLNVAKLASQLDKFGYQSIAEYIDSIFGVGTVTSILDFVKSAWDIKVEDIWDELVILASELEMDEEMLMEDVDTFLSIITKDIMEILDADDKQDLTDLLNIFYDEENDVYTIEYALTHHSNDSLYEAAYGVAPEDETEYKAYDEAYKARVQDTVNFVEKIQAVLYSNASTDNSIYAYLRQITSYFGVDVKDAVQYLADNSELIKFAWTLDETGENIATFAIDIDVYDEVLDGGEVSTSDLFSFAYNFIDNELLELGFAGSYQQYKFDYLYSTERVLAHVFDLSDEKNPQTIFEIDYDCINSILYTLSLSSLGLPYVSFDVEVDEAHLDTFELQVPEYIDIEYADAAIGGTLDVSVLDGAYLANVKWDKVLDEANSSSGETIDTFKFVSMEELYNAFMELFTSFNVKVSFIQGKGSYKVYDLTIDNQDSVVLKMYNDKNSVISNKVEWSADLSTVENHYIDITATNIGRGRISEVISEEKDAITYTIIGYNAEAPSTNVYYAADITTISLSTNSLVVNTCDGSDTTRKVETNEKFDTTKKYYTKSSGSHYKYEEGLTKFESGITYYVYDANLENVQNNKKYLNGFGLLFDEDSETLTATYYDYYMNKQYKAWEFKLTKESFVYTEYEDVYIEYAVDYTPAPIGEISIILQNGSLFIANALYVNDNKLEVCQDLKAFANDTIYYVEGEKAGTFVKVANDATFDENETYYKYIAAENLYYEVKTNTFESNTYYTKEGEDYVLASEYDNTKVYYAMEKAKKAVNLYDFTYIPNQYIGFVMNENGEDAEDGIVVYSIKPFEYSKAITEDSEIEHIYIDKDFISMANMFLSSKYRIHFNSKLDFDLNIINTTTVVREEDETIKEIINSCEIMSIYWKLGYNQISSDKLFELQFGNLTTTKEITEELTYEDYEINPIFKVAASMIDNVIEEEIIISKGVINDIGELLGFASSKFGASLPAEIKPLVLSVIENLTTYADDFDLYIKKDIDSYLDLIGDEIVEVEEVVGLSIKSKAMQLGLEWIDTDEEFGFAFGELEANSQVADGQELTYDDYEITPIIEIIDKVDGTCKFLVEYSGMRALVENYPEGYAGFDFFVMGYEAKFLVNATTQEVDINFLSQYILSIETMDGGDAKSVIIKVADKVYYELTSLYDEENDIYTLTDVNTEKVYTLKVETLDSGDGRNCLKVVVSEDENIIASAELIVTEDDNLFELSIEGQYYGSSIATGISYIFVDDEEMIEARISEIKEAIEAYLLQNFVSISITQLRAAC